MVLDPFTTAIIASAITAGTQGGIAGINSAKEKRAAKRRAKETKRETFGGLYGDVLQNRNEMEAQRLSGRKKLGQRKAQASQETADIVRGAFNI